MDAVRTLAALLPLGLSSGINLYATVLVAGLSIRFGWVQNPPAGLEVLAAWPVIIAAGLFYLLEFLADKIQFVDNAWDLIHTFIRPIGAAVLAWAALGHADPVLVALGALAAGSAALVSHGSKAGTRVALNVASPLENVSNIGISLAEDVLAGGLTFLALKFPLAAALLSLGLLIVMVLVVPQLLRWTWFALRSLAAWVRSLTGDKQTASEALPPAHAAAVAGSAPGQPPELVVYGKAQNIKGAGGRSGYLTLTPAALLFTYEVRGQIRTWSVDRRQIGKVQLSQRALLAVVAVTYTGAGGRERVARVVFLKDRAPLAEQVALRLAGTGAATAAAIPMAAPTP